MALSEIDRNLLDRCLQRKPRAWEDFVDRFLGLVVHVVNHTAQARSVRLSPEEREDLAAEVFLAIIQNDFAILRHFRGQSSLATYLTVIARRIAVREILRGKSAARLGDGVAKGNSNAIAATPPPEQRISNREQVERLLAELDGTESKVVRLYHLEGKTYREIGDTVGMSENSVGPILSRARNKMRQTGLDLGEG
ncbi:MAG: sigma-70 family RNA polymerase sigma factor [Planctomycetes bacterium]|nr:sigma-70 family RNA polymerase sigma factor [Planctomycetota bacterium]